MAPQSLYPFQKLCVDFALSAKYSLNCCEQGLGKSRMALEAAKLSGAKKIAVFGPAFLKGVWAKEGEITGVKFDYFSYSVIHKYSPLQLCEYDFYIADELTYLKNPRAQRTHTFYDFVKTNRPTYFMGLTGTPVRNRIPDMWTAIAICDLNLNLSPEVTPLSGDLKKFNGFSSYFCHEIKSFIRGRQITKFGSVKDEKIPEFLTLLKGRYIRFKADEVLKDLPEMTYIDVPLPLAAAPNLKDEFEAYLAGGKVDSASKAMSAKLKAFKTAEYCQNLIDGGAGQLVIFSDHVESAKTIAEELGGKVITGEVSAAKRQNLVQDFQDGKLLVLSATIGSLSVGVTLTAANHIVFNDSSWVPSDNAQAEKRILRIGQTKACFCHRIISSPTDAYILKTLDDKVKTINKVIG